MRIFITGNAGSGKTTLSTELAKQMKFPLYGLDKFVWLPGWVRQKPEIIKEQLSEVVKQENWIIEGVSYFVMEHASIIIFLDVPIYKAYWRASRRTLTHLFKQRPEMPENCPELAIVKELIRIIWVFHHQVRNTVINKLEKYKMDKTVYHVRNNAEQVLSIKELLINTG